MATATLRADSACEKPFTKIHEIALNLQLIARRVAAVASAIGNATEALTPEHDRLRLDAIGKVDDLASIIEDFAAQAREEAEKIEVLSGKPSFAEAGNGE